MITVNDAKLIIDNHVQTKGIEKVNLDKLRVDFSQ